jgi:hypothetical protein
MKQTKTTKSFDRENILLLVSKQAWQQIIEEFKDNDNYNTICSDGILKPLIDTHFISELLNNSTLNNDPAYKYYLEQFCQMHDSTKFNFKLSDSDYRKLIIKIVEVEQMLDYAYKYALKFPDEPICKKVILEYQEQLPKYVKHSQQGEIIVTENRNIRNIDARIGLFKSQQEYQFYRATIDVFLNFLVIPNVALSAVIDFGLVKDNLTNEEKNYFFKALIDCVVINTEDNFKPIRFIELDSIYHDTEEQQQRDKMKDNIFSAAGQKLLRVRLTTPYNTGQTNFEKLIRETLQ